MKSEKELKKDAEKHLAKRYRDVAYYESLSLCQDPQERIFRKLDRDLKLKGKTILDIGAGTGRLTIPMARKARLVYALDILKPNLDLMMRKARKAGLKNIKALKAPFRKIPLPDSSVDMVTSLLAFPYHSDNWDRDLKEIRRVLKPGGWMAFIDVHYAGSEHQRIRKSIKPEYHMLAVKRHMKLIRKGFRLTTKEADFRFRTMKNVREICGKFLGDEYTGYLLAKGKTTLRSMMAFYYKRRK
jgi:ubiquinone/menaquinone biosynthesis C-methylase UbiE